MGGFWGNEERDNAERGGMDKATLGLALLQAGANISAANQPGWGHPTPSLGSLFGAGAGGFAQGYGNAMRFRQQEQRQAQEDKLAQLQYEMALGKQAREAQEQSARDKAAGDFDAYINTLPENERAAARAMGDAYKFASLEETRKQREIENDFRRRGLGLQAAALNRKDQPQWEVDLKNGVRVNPATGEIQPLMMAGEGGQAMPWTPPKGQIQGAPNKAQEDDDKKQLGEVRESMGAAARNITDYDTALGLLNRGVGTGYFFGPMKKAREIGAPFGLGDQQTLADMQALDSTMERIRLKMSEYMKGAVSEYEQKIMQKAAGSTELTPAALSEVLTVARNIEQRNMANAVGRRDYFERHGTFSGYRSPEKSQQGGGQAKRRRYNPQTGGFE